MVWFRNMTPGDIANNDRERLLNFSDSHSAIQESTLTKDSDEVKVYKKRWYILAMFFLLCVGQGIMYNTWSPIQSTARAVYKWDSFMIDLMPALGCIAPCFTIVPLGWLMDVKGTTYCMGFRYTMCALMVCIRSDQGLQSDRLRKFWPESDPRHKSEHLGLESVPSKNTI